MSYSLYMFIVYGSRYMRYKRYNLFLHDEDRVPNRSYVVAYDEDNVAKDVFCIKRNNVEDLPEFEVMDDRTFKMDEIPELVGESENNIQKALSSVSQKLGYDARIENDDLSLKDYTFCIDNYTEKAFLDKIKRKFMKDSKENM